MVLSSYGFSQTTSPTTPQSSNAAFLMRAMQDSQAEVEIGHIAETRAQNPQVRDFASMMVRDHTRAVERIRRAMNNGAATGTDNQTSPVLTKDDQDLADRLANLSGAAFDREYVNAMVEDHRKTVHEFEQEAGVSGKNRSSSNDSDRKKPNDDTTESPLPTDDNPIDKNAHAPDHDELFTATPSNNTRDTSARSVARELLPTLRNHLLQAERLQRTLQN